MDNTTTSSSSSSSFTSQDLREIREGYEVVGTDGQRFGTVEDVLNDGIQVNGQRVALAAIERVEGNRVYLRVAGADYLQEGALRVPIIEERLIVGKRTVEAGAAEIRTTVESEQQNVDVNLMREEVTFDTRTVERQLTAEEAANAFTEGVIRVPVREEQAVVSKEAVVTGEVVVNKQQTNDQQTISDTIRRTRVDVDDNYQQVRGRYEQKFQNNQSQYDATNFEEAEPNYQVGYVAAQSNQGQSFDQAETTIRDTYYSDTNDDEWARLRGQVRDAYDDVEDGRVDGR